MLEFRLVVKKYSEVDEEWQLTYACHYKIAHAEAMTDQLILDIINFELNDRIRMKPKPRINQRDIYVREWIPYGERDYWLVFWFKDGVDNHLWIRNCYPLS